ncbi:hypothetical protein SAMN05192539_102078 [Paraburkholderia diazotrophica]|uniref:Uncharacterized protein n=1 Tax=Paraburkholderia diazotrophica TaxID=667676 RepID=A0A1H7C4I3_9BURK|nr:hypothetical protein SAMN05192539_102078 [Paraburkholderia diazotrophica]
MRRRPMMSTSTPDRNAPKKYPVYVLLATSPLCTLDRCHSLLTTGHRSVSDEGSGPSNM